MAKVKKVDEEERYFTRSGVELTPEVIDELVKEAERGYDPRELRAQFVGRPSLSENGVSPRLTFRAPADLHAAAQRRADEEGKSISELAREALQRYLES
ncbi:MAG TPA: ribbon-helix-helix protein, CopG family [Solirubrobacterales bacterium]|nr:ribbon-helix-helix protein, CopG family [Solirubrobacterales bacterium]